MSLEPRSFSLLELADGTPGLSGPERLAVFGRLPRILREQAWHGLREWTDHRSACDFKDWCRDGV